MTGEHFDHEAFEETARDIVLDTKGYANFRPYMTDPCPDVDVCESCMCPRDSRLNAKETEDAMYACKLSEHGRNKKQGPLTAFIRKHCANWDGSGKSCIGVDGNNLFHEGACLIGQGKPCAYFEKAVFPICDPSYRYASETEQYQVLLDLYFGINPDIPQVRAQKVRLCGCGTPLKPRRRVCDKCAEKRRRTSRRKSYHKTAS